MLSSLLKTNDLVAQKIQAHLPNASAICTVANQVSGTVESQYDLDLAVLVTRSA